MGGPVCNIRIEVDPKLDDRLDAWAAREKRAKKAHIEYLLRLLADLADADPLIAQRLALGATTPGRPTVAGAAPVTAA